MVLAVGEKIPEVTFTTFKDGKPTPITTSEIFSGKNVVLFSVPGAFTPTCSNDHCPGFKNHFNAIKAKGIDTIAVTAVNDAFVLQAWNEHQKTDGQLLALADGNGTFVDAIELSLDLTAYGMGKRGKRFALIAKDGVVTWIGVDDAGLDKSSAESVLAALQ